MSSDGIERGAEMSVNQRYRYALTRRWREQPGGLLWIMLNPSTADAMKDDATIRKCMGFARRWGYGQITVVNLFAFRSTDPDALMVANDPVGPDNDHWIAKCAAEATGVAVGWGGSGPPDMTCKRALAVQAILGESGVREAVCIGFTATGMPRHPSRPPYASELAVYWTFPAAAVPGEPPAKGTP
jgi:hypothetical protein